MSNLDQDTFRARGAATTADYAIDQGLRSFMLGVYNYMTVALVITGLSALAIANVDTLQALFFQKIASPLTGKVYYKATILAWIAIFAPLGMVFFVMPRIYKMSVASAQTMFWIFAALIGVSIASALLTFTSESVARVFFITAAAFGGLSLWGYTTKKDLSGWGSFLIMGVIGLIIAMIVNIFLASSALHWAISILGVGIFAGLTAYDTQNLKNMYLGGLDREGHEMVQKVSIMGALRLYLDFINLFMFLLQLLGERR